MAPPNTPDNPGTVDDAYTKLSVCKIRENKPVPFTDENLNSGHASNASPPRRYGLGQSFESQACQFAGGFLSSATFKPLPSYKHLKPGEGFQLPRGVHSPTRVDHHPGSQSAGSFETDQNLQSLKNSKPAEDSHSTKNSQPIASPQPVAKAPSTARARYRRLVIDSAPVPMPIFSRRKRRGAFSLTDAECDEFLELRESVRIARSAYIAAIQAKENAVRLMRETEEDYEKAKEEYETAQALMTAKENKIMAQQYSKARTEIPVSQQKGGDYGGGAKTKKPNPVTPKDT